jgi:hypothetical protein
MQTKTFFRAVAALVAAFFISQASAQYSKPTLNAQVSSSFPSNNTGAITPAILSTFMNNLIASFQQYASVNAQTGTTYTFSGTDYGQLVTFNNASPVAVTLPQASGTFTTWNTFVNNIGAGIVTITPTVSTINGASSYQLKQGSGVWIVSDGTNYQIFGGAGIGTVTSVTCGTGLTGGTITLSGTCALANPVALNLGGTGSALTASNGGIVYSNASGMAILTPTATANQIVLSGASSAPSFSTTTWPSTVTASSILYANGANAIAGLATANNGTLITSGSGVPSISSTLPSAVQGNITSTGTLTSGSTGAGYTLNVGVSTVTGTVPNANLTTATSSTLGISRPDNSSITVSAGVLTTPTATSSALGIVKPDNSTITISGGTLTAIGSSATAVTVGSTTVSSGTSPYCLNDNAGTLGNVNCATLTGTDQALTGGAIVTAYGIGSVSSGTTTLDLGKSPFQTMLNAGASTIAAPTNSTSGSSGIQVVNGSSAGAITLSGFVTSPTGTGDAFSTANTASGTATFTNSSASISYTNTFVAGQKVYFTTNGTLPTNFTASTIYYVISTGLSGSAFEVSATLGGSAITAGSAGSGTQTVHVPSVFLLLVNQVDGTSTAVWKQQQ